MDEMRKRFSYWKRNMSRDGDVIGRMPSLVSWEAGWNAALKYGGTQLTSTNTASHATAPIVVCLCGSTRFFKEFMLANYQETMAGRIVLSVGFYPHSSEQAHGEHIGVSVADKVKLDDLHKRKIDICNEVLVINVGGYIGESTRSEIDYAVAHEKRVRYLEPQQA